MGATNTLSNPSIGTSHHSLERGVAMSVQELSSSCRRTMANFFWRKERARGEPLLLDAKPRLLILISVLRVLRRRLADEVMAVRAVQETSTFGERGIAYNTTLFRQEVSPFFENRRLVLCQGKTNVYPANGKHSAGQPHLQRTYNSKA